MKKLIALGALALIVSTHAAQADLIYEFNTIGYINLPEDTSFEGTVRFYDDAFNEGAIYGAAHRIYTEDPYPHIVNVTDDRHVKSFDFSINVGYGSHLSYEYQYVEAINEHPDHYYGYWHLMYDLEAFNDGEYLLGSFTTIGEHVEGYLPSGPYPDITLNDYMILPFWSESSNVNCRVEDAPVPGSQDGCGIIGRFELVAQVPEAPSGSLLLAGLVVLGLAGRGANTLRNRDFS